MLYISRVHPNDLSWHIVMDVGYKKGPHPPPHYNNKHEQVRFILNIMDFKCVNPFLLLIWLFLASIFVH
jgi:hypothetical protein